MDSYNNTSKIDSAVNYIIEKIKNPSIVESKNFASKVDPVYLLSVNEIRDLYNHIEKIKKLKKNKTISTSYMSNFPITLLIFIQKYLTNVFMNKSKNTNICTNQNNTQNFNNIENNKKKELLQQRSNVDEIHILKQYNSLNKSNECRKSLKNYNTPLNLYVNKYEYGAKQDQSGIGMLYKPVNHGCYFGNNTISENIGLNDDALNETFPGNVRNINVESAFNQQETTHFPGQRQLTETHLDRFNLLPFNPQNTNHIVWHDNMPRGGYATRTDRLSN